MSEIVRKDVNEEWAHSGIIKAGDYCYLNYCAGNVGGTIEEQINGAFDVVTFIFQLNRTTEEMPRHHRIGPLLLSGNQRYIFFRHAGE